MLQARVRWQANGGPTAFAVDRMKSRSVPAVLLSDLNLLRCFAGRGVATVVVSSDPNDVTFSSRYCDRKEVIAPVSQPENALRDLLNLGRQFPERPVLIYGDDATLLLVSRNRDHLAAYYRFLLPNADLVEDLVDKTRFAHLASRLGLSVPRAVLSRELRTPDDVLARLSLPCVLKPNYHIGWFESHAILDHGGYPRKVLWATTAEELHRRYAQMWEFTDDFVVQEYIAGDATSIYSFHAYFDRHSEPIAYYVGRKIRTYPRESGVSTYLELVKEPRVVEAGLDVLRTLRFMGIVKLDFKLDMDRQRLYLLEINPRFNLWHYLGAVSGVNLPSLAYADLVGASSRARPDYTTGIRWLSFGNDLRGFLLDYHPSGRLSWRAWLLSFGRRKIYDVFSWRDPYPFVLALLRYLKNHVTHLGEWFFR